MSKYCFECVHYAGHAGKGQGVCSEILKLVSLSDWPGGPTNLLVRSYFGCILHDAVPGVVGDEAHARASDPETSHAAARTVKGLNGRRLDVLVALDRAMTDRLLVQRFDLDGTIVQGASGIRTRRAELVQLGLVAHVDTLRDAAGRKHRVWQRTAAGDRAALTGKLS